MLNRLKAVLADKGKTSRWLAEQIGKSENTVSRWCANKVQPSIQQLNEIATILDVDLRSLVVSTKE
jgi:transcriptional regulator with XRE-family HTH domain